MVNHDHDHLSMLDIGKNNCSNTPINVLIKVDNNPTISTKICKNRLHSKENMGNNAILNLHPHLKHNHLGKLCASCTLVQHVPACS